MHRATPNAFGAHMLTCEPIPIIAVKSSAASSATAWTAPAETMFRPTMREIHLVGALNRLMAAAIDVPHRNPKYAGVSAP